MNIRNTSRKIQACFHKIRAPLRHVFTLALILTSTVFSRAGGVVTDCTETDLRAAVVGGGLVTFDCDGLLNLANTLNITNDTTIDAAGHSIVLQNGPVIQPVRLFQIDPGVTLILNHLTLANASVRGTNSTVNNSKGGPAFGGAVFNAGTLQATDCVFSNNMVLGGTGGPGAIPLALNFGGDAFGGAIFNNAGTLSLTNVLFIGNSAKGGMGGTAPSPPPSKGGSGGISAGGAIYSSTGIVALVSCRFVSNSAAASVPGPNNGYQPNSGAANGGAIYFAAGTNMIVATQFERQFVGGGQWFCDAQAGAIYQSAGSLRIIGCSFTTNKVIGGDGIIIGSGSNAGSADGGALFIVTLGTGEQGSILIYCDAVVSNSCFIGNSVKGGLQGPAVGSGGTAHGGAIESLSRLQMFNCTLAGNAAIGGDITFPSYPMSSAYGGALYLTSTSILTHVTLANNIASRGAGAGSGVAQGGGIYVLSGARVNVRNSIISSGAPANCNGTLFDDGCNISSDGSCGFGFPGSLNNTDPILAPFGFYGGATLNMPLRAASPAINTANAAYSLATDQRGAPRPQGLASDIGAVEGPTISMQNNGNGNFTIYEGAPPGASCTLQASPNLTDWSDFQTVAADTSGWAAFAVTNNAEKQFFRSVELP